jgi:tyrosyl-tRNA synthetase
MLKKRTESVEATIETLLRTSEEFHSLEEMKKLLGSGKQLRMKYGVDLTAPLLHTGHAVNLWMYRDLQELGHKVCFLLGDFTTSVGDPTGRSKTRPVLTADEIEANAQEFLRQVSMVLITDPEVFEVRRNSEWFSKMGTSQFLSLLSIVTHDRLIARDMFQRRIENKLPIYMHEMLYPILQGYDSVMLDADLTIVGSDQLFNEMMGRFFQERFGKAQQVIITSVLTPGIDGKEKQSKSLGNYIGLGHSPRDKFGRIMSIPDSLVAQYFKVYTKVEIAKIEEHLAGFKNDPMGLKRLLAREMVARYHGMEVAQGEDDWFTSTFSKREAPQDAPLVHVGAPSIELLKLLKLCMPDKSNSDLRRLVEQGAVSLHGERLSDIKAPIALSSDAGSLQVGKRQWFRVQL